MVNEMPKMVMERYSSCQTVAFCGVFPEIKRAWASVDNSLFLWRYDRWQDVPIEFSGVDQSIVAAGIFVPKSKVFQPAIQHILVLCTTTEISFIGVCHDGDDFEEIILEKLSQYTVSSDNVSMISVSSNKNGRVFLGGADGNLYEITYAAKDTWRTKRCLKVCHTRGIRAYLPSFIPATIMGTPQPIVQILVDDERHILYTRSQSSVLCVFDLGADGKQNPSKVADISDFAVDASRALGGREVFGRGAGEKKGARAVYMAVIPKSVSRRIQLLTVTADGRRVYWSACSSRTSSPRPDRLKAEIARRAVPIPSNGRSYNVGNMGRSLEVLAACAISDTLILAEATPNEAKTSLFVISRDTTIPPIGTATGAFTTIPGLRESVSQLEFPLPGEACAIREVSGSKYTVSMLPQSVGSNQNHGMTRRFAVATTAGVAEVEMLSPAEILSTILLDGDMETLEMFFASYGAIEACAMCIHLACGPSASSSSSKPVSGLAENALDNPRLCGQPELASVDSKRSKRAEEPAAHLGTGFDMGAVVPIEEPEWSAAHKGICLVVSRLLRGIWDEPLFTYISSAPEFLSSTIDLHILESLCETLRNLSDFLTRYIQNRKSSRSKSMMDYMNDAPINKRQKIEDAIRAEVKRTEQVNALISRVADGCYLLMVLYTHNISRLAARLETGARRSVRSLRFREWMSHDEGDEAASQLIAALISEHLNESGEFSTELAVTLQKGCPSYFKDNDRKYYDARSLLRKAEGVSSPVDRENITRDAVSLLLRVPLSCDLAQVIPQLAMLRAIDYIVELTVKKAGAVDPLSLASEDDISASQSAKLRRHESCYVHVCDLLKVLKDPSRKPPASLDAFEKSLEGEERVAMATSLLSRVSSSNDPFLQESIYATLIEINCIQDLLGMGGENLENYLFQSSGLTPAMNGMPAEPLTDEQVVHAEVLAKYYIKAREYIAAAGVYEHLSAQVADVVVPPKPSLEKRVQYLESAVLQARSCGDAGLVERLKTKTELGHIQIKLENLLQRKGLLEHESKENHSDISTALLSLEKLYNDIACRYKLWKECLELINVSSYDDTAYVQQVWDLFMEGEWHPMWERRQGTSDASAEALDAMCSAVASLGRTFYPNESSLPVAFILCRFEQAAAGLWPEETNTPRDGARIVRKNLLHLCCESYEGAMEAYDALMTIKTSEPNGAEMHDPEMRFRILCSIKDLVDAALDGGLDNQFNTAGNEVHKRRLLGILASACESYASEARQLPLVSGDSLGKEFDETARNIESKLKLASIPIY
jgi:nuclear pore complex protein Nup155